MEIKTFARKWGNSIAVILPRDLVIRNNIKENDEVVVEIGKKVLAGDLFGRFPRKKEKNPQEIKNEMKRGW